MFESILIPYDGSQSSEKALATGIGVARRTDATVHVVYVVDIPGHVDKQLSDDGELTITGDGEEILASAVGQVKDADVPVEHEMLRGNVTTRLLEYAETISADLIVLGSHDRGPLRRFLQQSVAEQVVQGAKMPVLTVPEESKRATSKFEKILIATDGREGTTRATEVAFELAQAYDAMVLGLYVVDSRVGRSGSLRDILKREGRAALRELEATAAQVGVEFSSEQRTGAPAQEILEIAGSSNTDLVVMGTRGNTGLDRFLMGSVATRVLRKSPIPVLTARTLDDASP